MAQEPQPGKPRRRSRRIKAALGLARRGFRIHPCWPSTKRPILNDWPAKATTDPDTIRRLWRKWPRANIAIATGGEARLLVIDVDPDKGGQVALTEIEGEFSLPHTVAVQTPKGGTHLWLRVPNGHPLPGNSAGKLGPGIDTRSAGGYVLVPPSTVVEVLPSGRHHFGWYSWFKEGGDHIAEAPAWLLDRLERGGGNGEATSPEEWLTLATGGVDEGERNHSVARLAGKLFRHLPPADAELAAELIACWNAQRCRPPLEAEELARVLDSIAAAELRRRQGARP